MRSICLSLVLFLLLQNFGYSQSPYDLSFKKELPYYSVGLGSVALGKYLSKRSPFFTEDELIPLNASDINAFDRIATSQFSERHNKASDVLMNGSYAMPFVLLAGKKTRKSFGQIMLLYGEAVSMNAGFTLITKFVFKRPRPYIFNETITDEYKTSRKARTSFISGHTSTTTVNCFFAAKIFSDFYPDSKWKPVVWTLAATIPAATATLRVTAGKHYPTDVIAGYAMGATIGVLIPHLHRNKKMEDIGLRINVGYNSALVTWDFNRTNRQEVKIIY